MLVRLIRAGLDVARLNFSHGNPAKHAEVIRRIRDAARETGRRVAIMADLPGRNCGWEKSIRNRFNFCRARISR